MTCRQVVDTLGALANPANVAGMARYGISPMGTLGGPMPVLRRMVKKIGRRHDLADKLWRLAIHEAGILASLIGDPGKVTDDQMERWVLDIESWDVCDQLCSNLFSRMAHAREKAAALSGRPNTFIKQAGFVLIAGKPIGEPVAWYGPIVINMQEKLRIAFEEYENGTFIKHKKA